MKSILLSVAIALAVIGQTAGQKQSDEKRSGTVTYEETMKIEFKLEGEAARLIRDMPTERKSTKILKFTPDAATFTTPSRADADVARHVQAEGVTVAVRMSEPENIVHTDLKKKRVTEMREFMTRRFLIDRDFKQYDWKITGNQKEIAGYACMEATRTDPEGKKIAVWFAPQIEIPLGPGLYNNLPGMVLEVVEDEGKRVITAKEVLFTAVNAKELARPSDGKKVTADEFDEIVKEKMKEMGVEGSGGTMKVIIRNEE
jgi:GLPGLI family protein